MSRVALAILWPSFLMAGVLEAIVFAAVDPGELHVGYLDSAWSPLAVYTVAFLVFWGVLSTSGAITALLWFEPDDHRDAGARWPR